MKTLEKSIRSILNPLRRNLHKYDYSASGGGFMPEYGYIEKIVVDVNEDAGVITNYRVYVYGDSQQERDYHGKTCDITNEIVDYMRSNRSNWDNAVGELLETITAYINSDDDDE